jgi:uncharacterized protein (TIGR00661 family)
VTDRGHYTVYLPSYDDKKLLPILNRFPRVRWHVFSKHTRSSYHTGKISVHPVNNEEFTASLTSCTGVLCGAGFETPAEALYLQKRLLVVPMKGQYEQHYNAAALRQLGVPVMKKVKKKSVNKIREWLDGSNTPQIFFEDITEEAVGAAMGLAQEKDRKEILIHR